MYNDILLKYFLMFYERHTTYTDKGEDPLRGPNGTPMSFFFALELSQPVIIVHTRASEVNNTAPHNNEREGLAEP